MSLQIRLKLPATPDGPRLDVDLDLPSRGVTAVFGPSGGGKTTLLRGLAGLESRARGRIRLDDVVWLDDTTGIRRPTHRRAVGYVFQEGALFPHLSVRGNLEFGRRRRPRPRPGPHIDEVVAMLELGDLLDRAPATLSGGERQRTALGRALLTQPDLLLLDEPLASLDRPARRRILPYLESLCRRTTVPIVLVTHDLDEAARLADHLVRLDAGRVMGDGPLSRMLTSAAPGLALEPDAGAVLVTTVSERLSRDHVVRLRFGGGELLVPDMGRNLGAEMRVRVLARDVSLTLAPAVDTSILNVLPARILELLSGGEARVVVRLGLGDDVLLAAVTGRSARRLELAPGRDVYAQVKSIAVL